MARKKTSAQLDREIAAAIAKPAAAPRKKKPRDRRTEAMRAVRREAQLFLSGRGRLTEKTGQELVDRVLRDYPGYAAQGSDLSIEVWDTAGDYSGPEFALWIEDNADFDTKAGEVS